MLSLPLVTLGLAAIGVYAKPAVRAPGDLEVSLLTPTDKVASMSDVRVVATVKNVGDEDLKILKFGTVLDDNHPTPSFIISKDGEDVPFTATAVPVSTDQLAEDDWVVIPAGKNVTVEHKAWALYDFSAGGPGTFTFDPVSRFQVIAGFDGSAEITLDTARTNIVNGRSVSISITISDVSKRELELEKRGLNNRCADSGFSSSIVSSVWDAAWLSAVAISYIENHASGDHLYELYFGKNAPTSTVIDNFRRIVDGAGSSSYTVHCDDPKKLCPRPIFAAYTTPPGKDIFYCGDFRHQDGIGSLCMKAGLANRMARGSTTLRMLAALFIPGAVDGNLGCTKSWDLPGADKIKNNDNYDCFASQIYANTKC